LFNTVQAEAKTNPRGPELPIRSSIYVSMESL